MYKLNRNELNKILHKKRISRSQLAISSNISIETLNSWSYRGTMATEECANRVCKFLNIDIVEIFDEV